MQEPMIYLYVVSGCRSLITWSSASPSTTIGGRSSTQMWYAVTGLPLSGGANHDTLTVVAVDDSCTCDITAGQDGGVVHRAAGLHGPAPASFTAWKPFTSHSLDVQHAASFVAVKPHSFDWGCGVQWNSVLGAVHKFSRVLTYLLTWSTYERNHY